MILHQVHDRVDAAVTGRFRRAKIGAHGQNVPFCRFIGTVDQLGHAFVLDSTDRNDRDAELTAHFFNVDRTAARADLVHHVQRQYHRHIQLQQLHGEVKIALDVGRVGDIDDAVRLFVQNILACDDLLLRIGAQRVDARQVNDRAVVLAAHGSRLLLHRHARKVADMAVHAREHVKERSLTAVLISGKCKFHLSASPLPASCTGSTVIFAASSRRMVSS